MESGRRREPTLSRTRLPRVSAASLASLRRPPAPPGPGLTRQLVGLQPAVCVDPAQHEVVREAAGGRGGARARAGRRAAPAHPGRAAPAAAASREGSPLRLRSPRACPRATPARPWPRSRRSSPQPRSPLGTGEAAASSRPVGPNPGPGWGRGGQGECRRERLAPPQLRSRTGNLGVWRPPVS